MLRSQTNTPRIKQAIIRAAKNKLRDHIRMSADFEHGQWWITCIECGAQWFVCDCVNRHGGEYFDFEQVTNGDEYCLNRK